MEDIEKKKARQKRYNDKRKRLSFCVTDEYFYNEIMERVDSKGFTSVSEYLLHLVKLDLYDLNDINKD